MAPLPRFFIPGQPQPVIQGGNNREVIFAKRREYRFYLKKVTKAGRKYHCEIKSWVLMTDPFHALMTPQSEGGIRKTMMLLGRDSV